MAELAKEQEHLQDIRSKGKHVYENVREKMGGAYEGASDWFEDNSMALLSVGLGVVTLGLLTYFIARRQRGSSEVEGDVEQAA